MCGATIMTITIVNTDNGMNRIGKKVAAMNKRVNMKVFIMRKSLLIGLHS
jgi:hypothetical protein